MQEIKVKTHLVITDIHEEYEINWCGRLADTDPLMRNDMPVFALVSGRTRVEMNTWDIAYIEKVAKKITNPHGRKAVTTDSTRIYIKEVSGKETLVGVVIHSTVKKYAPMYDAVGFSGV